MEKILLKNPMNASTRLSMNGKSPIISTAPPFVPSSSSGRALRLSKDERRVFQQNLEKLPVPFSFGSGCRNELTIDFRLGPNYALAVGRRY